MRTHPLCALVLLPAAALSLPALAAEAEIYGLVDAGFKLARSTGEDAAFAMQSGQINGSRIGLRISEKLSSHLRIYANLENGFDADTGELGSDGVLFNRNSILGVKTVWGSFEFGRTGALASGNAAGVFAGKVSPSASRGRRLRTRRSSRAWSRAAWTTASPTNRPTLQGGAFTASFQTA